MKKLTVALFALFFVLCTNKVYAQCESCNQTPNVSAPSAPGSVNLPSTPTTPTPQTTTTTTTTTHLPAPLAATSTAVRFDWQAQWGKINFAGGTDEGILSSRLQPKADIKRVISTSGTQTTDLSSLRVYGIDLNADGKEDFIIDGNGYFPQYFKASTAPVQICTTADGCYLSIYLSGSATNIISDQPAHANACPATAAANTTCQTNCAATEQNCAANFQYNTRTIFNEQVLSWSFMTAPQFQTWAAGKSYQLLNANPVFVAHRNNNKCYNDEISMNNNECVKYYQYSGDFSTGSLKDLYVYHDASDTSNYTTCFSTSTNGVTTPLTPGAGNTDSNGFSYHLSPGETVDLQLSNFSRVYHDGTDTTPPTPPSPPGFAHYQISNYSNVDYFVPANSNIELCSFIDSHQPGVIVVPARPTGPNPPQCPPEPPTPVSHCPMVLLDCVPGYHPINGTPVNGCPTKVCVPNEVPCPPPPVCPHIAVDCALHYHGVSVLGANNCPITQCVPDYEPPCPPPTPETVHFTTWTGELTCPTNLTTPETIAASRSCVSSNGAARSCSACMESAVLADGVTPDPTRAQGCSVTQTCAANTCVFNEAPADPYIGSHVRQYNGVHVSEAGCSAHETGLWATLWELHEVDAYGGCHGTFEHICQSGNFCFAAETLISLPGGETKRIDQIKAGDMVLGFKSSKGALKPFKVKSLAVTPDQDLLTVNGELQLTPNHEVVTSRGAKVKASALKVGDVLLRGDGTKLTVATIEKLPTKNTVYNLKLEQAGAGFVAGGVRVIGYTKAE